MSESAALHELRHVVALAVGAEILHLDAREIPVIVHVDKLGNGQVAAVPVAMMRHQHDAIMAMGALGPLAGDPDAPRKIVAAKSLNHPALDRLIGRLSDDDRLVIDRATPDPVRAAIVVAAVQGIEAAIGDARLLQLVALVKRQSQTPQDPMTLGQWVPVKHARRAVEAARAAIQKG